MVSLLVRLMHTHAFWQNSATAARAARAPHPSTSALQSAISPWQRGQTFMTNDNTPETFEPTASQKKLLRVVYVMGLLLVLLFLALIGGIIWKATKPRPAATPEILSMGLGLKAGDIKAVDVDGGTLAITTSGELIVIDAGRRKILLREPLAP